MKVGIITFTDGRKRIFEKLRSDCFGFQNRITAWLRSRGHEVVEGDEIIWNHQTVRREARLMTEGKCDAVIFNFCVWSFPDFTVQAAALIPSPIFFIGNINPGYPGWVAFFASAGALDEVGRLYGRALGDIDEPAIQQKLERFLEEHEPDARRRGVAAARKLRGERYGEFDGPSMGMYTGHVDQSQWMRQLGIHVHHVSQLTLTERAKAVRPERVKQGLEWLEKYCGKIHWDKDTLTAGSEGTLARQVRLYLAIKDLCKEQGVDFCGITAQLDLTESQEWCTADVPEALLNDTADWEDEKKKPLICATECDSNGGLTMQLMHKLTGTPALFADLRHYHRDLDLFDLVNSGQHAPWFSKRSDDFRKNWAEVNLWPASKFYFLGGGASVQFYADPADCVTFARITRRKGSFRMHIFTGEFVKLTRQEEERLARQTTYEWPHAFARFDCSYDAFVNSFAANHIHGVLGNHVAELLAACEELDIDPILLEQP